MIRDLLSRPVAYHPALARLSGSVLAAVFLSQALYWQERIPAERPRPPGCPGQDWFYHTIEEWRQETGLSRFEQKTARAKLMDLGVLEEKKAGIPARLFFRIRFDVLENILKNSQFAMSLQTRMRRGSKQVCGEAADKDAASPQTTQETTPETTSSPPPPDQNQGGGYENPNPETKTLKTGIEEINEYIRLGRLFGGKNGLPPSSPPAWEARVRARILKQGGLSGIDLEQLRLWERKEQQRKKAEAQDQGRSGLEPRRTEEQEAAGLAAIHEIKKRLASQMSI